jgi:crossover junction endodeoxyribonuclease RuvC
LRIMGIDPGTARTGYGIIEFLSGRFKVIHYGCVRTEAGLPLPDRLLLIYNDLSKLIEIYRPELFAIEELFFNKNTRTVMSVGQARGVAVLAGAKAGLLIYEYTPLQVKQAVAGYGRAAKQQVEYMVKALLNLKEKPSYDDVTDALAVAICCAFSSGESNLLLKNQEIEVGRKNPKKY